MDETQQYFNDVAGQWDEMRRQFFGEGVRRAAVAAARITHGAVVVDVGTGTGFLADAALEAGARVIGVDASEGMLEQVRKRFAGAAFEARAGEVDAIPVEDRSADAVLANMVLHHAPDPSHAIVEMTRILKAGRPAGHHRCRHAHSRMVAHRDARSMAGVRPRRHRPLVPRGRAARGQRDRHQRVVHSELAMRHAGGDHDLPGVGAKALRLNLPIGVSYALPAITVAMVLMAGFSTSNG